MKSLKGNYKTTFKEFFSRSTIHGLGYWVDGVSFLDRILWIIVTIVMFCFAFVYVREAVLDWQERKIILINDEINRPINAIQFPTVTICADFTPDRWGFIRYILDLLAFECDLDETCEDSMGARQFFAFADDDGEFPNAKARELQELLFLTTEQSIDTFKYRGWFKLSSLTQALIAKYKDLGFEYDFDRDIYSKLMGKVNNFGFFQKLNFTLGWDAKMNGGDPDVRISPDYLSVSQIMALMMTIALPSIGPLGTALTNCEQINSQPGNWFGSSNSYSYTNLNAASYFVDILDSMTRGQLNNVSVIDIAPILDPVEDFQENHLVSRQFPQTSSHFPNTEWSKDNFFGKLLGPHLMLVMEIMYLNSLRTRPLPRWRYLSHPDIYGSDDEFKNHVKFPLGDQGSLRRPRYSWSTIRGVFGMPLFPNFVSDEVAIFQNRFSNQENVDEDKILEELALANQRNRMILLCNGPGNEGSCIDKFEPVLTDLGICFTFNGDDINALMKNNTYMSTFNEVYEPRANNEIISNKGHGKSFQLFLILDSQRSKVYDSSGTSFKVAVTQSNNYMSIRDAVFDVQPGYFNRIIVSAVQSTASENFEELSDKPCKFAYEQNNTLSLYRNYSYASCIFECKLRVSAAKCGCTPWNYPQYGNESIQTICDGMSSFCFEKSMSNTTLLENCTCLPDCTEIQFTTRQDKWRLDYEEECFRRERKSDFLKPSVNRMKEVDLSLIVGEKIRHMPGEEYFFWLEKMRQHEENAASTTSGNPPGPFGGGPFGGGGAYTPNRDIQAPAEELLLLNKFYRYLPNEVVYDKCVELVKRDFALLSIEMSQPHISVIKKDVIVVQFFAKIATIGGTVGLFTGMSLLSMVEVIFWTFKLLFIPVTQRTK